MMTRPVLQGLSREVWDRAALYDDAIFAVERGFSRFLKWEEKMVEGRLKKCVQKFRKFFSPLKW